jgi:hypothetical protein
MEAAARRAAMSLKGSAKGLYSETVALGLGLMDTSTKGV